ncbi:unnamed protein product [Phytomonas sp. EM1]|nr:unnamed protein product [Phytomonas sp. EM1]|eukprot:CCW61616.1 unnamed protein product [Phytomonas sp. isolate EM1]
MKFHVRPSLAFSRVLTAPRRLVPRQLIRDASIPLRYRLRPSIVCPVPMFCSGVMQSQSRRIHSNTGFLDDDFVDLYASIELNNNTLDEQGNNSPIGITTSTAAANLPTASICGFEEDEPILGVVHTPPEDPGVEYSRFHIPLETPRGGKPIPRSNSRSMEQPGGESLPFEDVGEEHAKSSPSGSVGDEEKGSATQDLKSAIMPKGLFDSALMDKDGATTHQTYDRMPEPSSLPYDDEAFAEMLLQMEVDGAIDETWQDARKAYVEDVKELCEVLRSLKVRDICCIDVSDKTASFDYIMCGTCEGPRHIHIAAWAAQEADSLHRVSKVSRKKTDELWEVVPIGRILLNLMVESLREELALERKWAVTRTMDPLSAANAPVSEGRHAKAHGLWTLTLNLQDLEDFEVDYCKDVLLRQV